MELVGGKTQVIQKYNIVATCSRLRARYIDWVQIINKTVEKESPVAT